MSGKYNSWYNVMFTLPQPIYVGSTDYIKGVVVSRRDNKVKLSKEDAKFILNFSTDMLEEVWGVPRNVEYLEPIKTFVAQNEGDDYEHFVLSTLVDTLDKDVAISKQRVWFFELKEYVECI